VFHLKQPDIRHRLEKATGVGIGSIPDLRKAMARLFEHFTKKGAKACAISLPPDFAPTGPDANAAFWMLAEFCRDFRLPFDLMIGVNRKVYVNGVEETTLDTAISAPLSAQPLLYLGGNVNDNRFYTGLMDEVLVFSRALTAGEILALYQCTSVIPPTITCPANITQQATDPMGKAVTFATPTASSPNGSVTVVCMPASGSVFPVGVTTVNCTATDAADHTATCSFTVTVLAPPKFTVSGIVTNSSSGSPLSGQKVRLVHYHQTDRVFLQTFTDANGAFQFNNIPQSKLVSVFPENKGWNYTPSLVRRQDFASDLVANFGGTEPTTASEQVAVAGIEVVQSVQDWKNEVPLVAGLVVDLRSLLFALCSF
jgi:hypothetical protein